MEKRILLIGNSSGLPGVKIDFLKYSNYFKSPKGGQWFNYEIIPLMNPRRHELISKINELKSLNLDYLIIIFSGHGGQKIETVMEINNYGELIYESEFENISCRQLIILDCCRAYSNTNDSDLSERVTNKANFFGNTIREIFESRILQSAHQTVKLYACEKGSVANDTPDGGSYSKNLIKAASQDNSRFILVASAHELASVYVKHEFPYQKPEIIIPRLLTNQQLIFGLN